MAAMVQSWIEMKMRRVETGLFYAASAVLNSLNCESVSCFVVPIRHGRYSELETHCPFFGDSLRGKNRK